MFLGEPSSPPDPSAEPVYGESPATRQGAPAGTATAMALDSQTRYPDARRLRGSAAISYNVMSPKLLVALNYTGTGTGTGADTIVPVPVLVPVYLR